MNYSTAQNVKSHLWDISAEPETPWLFDLGRPRCAFHPIEFNKKDRCAEIRPIFSSYLFVPVASILPVALSGLNFSIESSRWMLDLSENWDEEGAAAYNIQTWERAVQFLRLSAVTLWGNTGIVVPSPEIQNGPEGTIDLFWESEEATLLINIPVDPAEPAMFYGSNKRGDETRGTVQTDHANDALLLWARG